MFRLDILQNQWLILALTGGVALTLTICLGYYALWRLRAQDAAGPEAGPPAKARPRSFMPWILVLLYALTVVWAVIYTLMQAANPPNW